MCYASRSANSTDEIVVLCDILEVNKHYVHAVRKILHWNEMSAIYVFLYSTS